MAIYNGTTYNAYVYDGTSTISDNMIAGSEVLKFSEYTNANINTTFKNVIDIISKVARKQKLQYTYTSTQS